MALSVNVFLQRVVAILMLLAIIVQRVVSFETSEIPTIAVSEETTTIEMKNIVESLIITGRSAGYAALNSFESATVNYPYRYPKKALYTILFINSENDIHTTLNATLVDKTFELSLIIDSTWLFTDFCNDKFSMTIPSACRMERKMQFISYVMRDDQLLHYGTGTHAMAHRMVMLPTATLSQSLHNTIACI